MTGILTTALTGFFLLSSTSGLVSRGILQTEVSIAPGPEPERSVTKTLSVAMTGYNATPEQTDEDPFTTASGAYSNPDIIAARSIDLAGELPFGTVIQISRAGASATCGYSVAEEFIGLRVVADSMHPRMRNKIDILFDTNETVRVGRKEVNLARALGFCEDVEVQVVGYVDIARIPASQAELKAAIGKSALALNK